MTKTLKFVLLVVLLLSRLALSPKANAQIGPFPCGGNSDISTYRPEVMYSIGQVVISYGVSYQSLVNNNQGNTPCYSPSQWTTTIGSATGGPPTGSASGALSGTYPAPGLSTAVQANITSRATYVLEDYLSTADGRGGTDYGYAATNFCNTVGCSTLTVPIGLKTTHAMAKTGITHPNKMFRIPIWHGCTRQRHTEIRIDLFCYLDILF